MEWVRIGFAGSEEDALPLFFNRYTGEMTYTTPADYIRLEEDVSLVALHAFTTASPFYAHHVLSCNDCREKTFVVGLLILNFIFYPS